MVTRDGHAKVLDFGLAKLIEPQQPIGTRATGSSEVATALMPQDSTPGAVMGTVGYMSPEQAQGKTTEIEFSTPPATSGSPASKSSAESNIRKLIACYYTDEKMRGTKIALFPEFATLGNENVVQIDYEKCRYLSVQLQTYHVLNSYAK